MKKPSWTQLQDEPALMLAFGFGSGLAPKAPGTAGTLVGWLLAIPMALYQPWLLWAIVLIGLVFGARICQAGIDATGVDDHPGIVWDEMVAIGMVVALLPVQTPLWWLLGFGLFRLFDILKPPPIRMLEHQTPGGWGVMLDDLLAALYALLVIWLVLYLSLIRWFLPKVRVRAGRRAAARAALSGQIVDTVTNIKTVKLFAHHRHEDAAALTAMRELRESALHFGRLATMFRFSLMTIAGLVPVILVGGTLWLWSHGEISAGNIATTGAISLRIAQMTGWVSFALMGIYAAVGEVEDGMKTLTPTHGLVDADGANRLHITQAEVSFNNVSFAYGREAGGLVDINLTIRSGEKLGIVGASGAGKSTLVALLMRLYDPESGEVSIDGQSLTGVTQESLRRQIGMVTQETAMFNRSARDNILYGSPDATDEQVFDAAKRAEADMFIHELQDHAGRNGYDAYLGERGVKLSGGQRQRIALARAILKDAPILVLDEATSALDSEVEAAIQAALSRVMEGKTVLAIAHRLSTIARMDRIIVLDQGRIIEDGTHEVLLANGGQYARYWERQSGGFIGIEDTQK